MKRKASWFVWDCEVDGELDDLYRTLVCIQNKRFVVLVESWESRMLGRDDEDEFSNIRYNWQWERSLEVCKVAQWSMIIKKGELYELRCASMIITSPYWKQKKKLIIEDSINY